MPNTVFSNTYSYYYSQNTAYDDAGRVLSRSLGGEYLAPIPVVSNTYTYYAWTQQGGRLSNLSADKLSTPAYNLQTLDYQYDAGGNVTQILKNNSEQHSYTYDALSRLTYWDAVILPYYPLDSEAYTYDPATGNLWKKGPRVNSHP